MVVPCIWFEIRINYQLDAIEIFIYLARHVSSLHAHLQKQWKIQFPIHAPYGVLGVARCRS